MATRKDPRAAFHSVPSENAEGPSIVERIVEAVGNLLPSSVQAPVAVHCGQPLSGKRTCGVATLLTCSQCQAPRCRTHMNGQCPEACPEDHEHRQGKCNACFCRELQGDSSSCIFEVHDLTESFTQRIRESVRPGPW